VQESEELELMLAKLHCNEFSSEKISSTLDVTRSELQQADSELQSLNQQLINNREQLQRLQKDCHDAQEILHKEVGL